ncbi:hypothetical protein CORT_0E00600 [Candida orthopsilosis Co 90-125]|uniref:Uncharacterized protein n=1 Tax=Candida orthopsilosis (strain 90-125) TaxID=1136231 RepID=H8X6N9_CANO9|nr:hypothetical protein CORT_0E00600 [Candida orthopsilosis Co 90-125]CCG23650.1 hypothetical protein CORT_0E00600 [Candida orthopsilosis Co 90-125]
MYLFDLPTKLLITIIPNLLDLPYEYIIAILNIFLQCQSFKISAENRFGKVDFRDEEMIVTTLSDKEFTIEQGNFQETPDRKERLDNKFLEKVFISFSKQIESKHYMKNAISDFEVAKSLIWENYNFISTLSVWCGEESSIIPLCMYLVMLRIYPNYNRTTITYTSIFNDSKKFHSFFNNTRTYHDYRITSLVYQ